MPVEVVHWNPSEPVLPGRLARLAPAWRRPVNNFGDLIGPLLVSRILDHHHVGPATVVRDARLVAVGSIMTLSEPGDVVWGAGVNGKSMSVGAGAELDVRAVRGPLTRDLLMRAGADVPEVYGDPGLLWSFFWPHEWQMAENPAEDLRPYCVVPNLHDWRKWRGHRRAVNPRGPLREVIRTIALSEFVCGSSLHGIVIAESFGIPARLIAPSTEPDFKYADYYQGTGRPTYHPARNLAEALDMGGEPAPNWDPHALLDAFPIDLWQQG